MVGLVNEIAEIMVGEKEVEKLTFTHVGDTLKQSTLSTATNQKTKGAAYQVEIRIAIQSNQKKNYALNKNVVTSLRELNEDNQLLNFRDGLKDIKLMQKPKKNILRYTDYWSVKELSQLLVLPPKTLQEKYHINSIKQVETGISNTLLSEGLLLGSHTCKGEVKHIYMPTKNWDELCLPTCYIAGMGQGKTR